MNPLLNTDFIKSYLSKFTVYKKQTLFEPTMEEKLKGIKEKKCFVCGRKLYEMRNGNWYCKSKKHKLFISKKVFEKLSTGR
jgi:hypothetical protein